MNQVEEMEKQPEGFSNARHFSLFLTSESTENTSTA